MTAADTGLDLVAGGGGFIGSHLCEALLASGRRVRVVDNFATGHARHLSGVDVEVIRGDASDPEVAEAACAGVTRIFHLAARPSVPWSFEFPEQALQANHGTTVALIEAGAAAGASRLVFSSSSAIYGDDPALPKTEDMPPAPQSPYAEHKWMGEQVLRRAHDEGRLETVSLRYFNVYGPRQDPGSPYSGVISLFCRWALDGVPAKVFGDGLQTRDFIYVADVVAANLAAAAASGLAPGAVFNVARGERISVLELWQQVCLAAGCEPSEPTMLAARIGDVRHSVASIVAAERDLGFAPQVVFGTGLAQTLAYERQRAG